MHPEPSPIRHVSARLASMTSATTLRLVLLVIRHVSPVNPLQLLVLPVIPVTSECSLPPLLSAFARVATKIQERPCAQSQLLTAQPLVSHVKPHQQPAHLVQPPVTPATGFSQDPNVSAPHSMQPLPPQLPASRSAATVSFHQAPRKNVTMEIFWVEMGAQLLVHWRLASVVTILHLLVSVLQILATAYQPNPSLRTRTQTQSQQPSYYLLFQLLSLSLA